MDDISNTPYVLGTLIDCGSMFSIAAIHCLEAGHVIWPAIGCLFFF